MRNVRVISIFASLFLVAASGAFAQVTNLSDAAISNMLVTVAGHWQAKHGAPADGSYPAAISFAAAQSAAKPSNLEWEYAWGVNLFGQLHVADATGNKAAESFVLNHDLVCARYFAWLNSLTNTLTNTASLAVFQNTNAVLGTFFTLGKLDYCGSMTSQMLEGALRHTNGPTIEELQMALVTANYISNVQSRTNGTLYRPTDRNAIWADDLFMSCPFLVRWYQCIGDTNFLNDAAQQVMNFAGYLQDTNGLWFHGYFASTNAVNGIKWGRANGWAMVATAEILSVMPTNHPARSNLLSILARHIAGVESVQAPDGMWRQVLDHPEVWEETSCTAMFAYSIARAVNRGWIDATNMAVARRAFSAIAQLQTSANGAISNICPGTSLSNNIVYYTNKISLPPSTDDRHGPGPVMLAGAEILLTPKLAISPNGNQSAIVWNAGLTNFSLQATTNFTSWNAWTNPPAATNWQNTVNDSNASCRFFRLIAPAPGFPPAPLNFEAESLAYVTNGATASIVSDTNASGGYFVTLSGTAVGNYIEFTVTNVPAGAYHLKFAFKSSNNRAQTSVTVDGSPLGTLDEYWPVAVYPLFDFGAVNFAAIGNHTIRLTVTGKDAASSGYTIAADKFVFTPQ